MSKNKKIIYLVFFIFCLLGLSYVIYDYIISGYEKKDLLQIFSWSLLSILWFINWRNKQ